MLNSTLKNNVNAMRVIVLMFKSKVNTEASPICVLIQSEKHLANYREVIKDLKQRQSFKGLCLYNIRHYPNAVFDQEESTVFLPNARNGQSFKIDYVYKSEN